MDNINNESKDIAVRVAIRIRPLVEKELREGCQNCLETSFDSPQVGVIGTDKAFTFDYVFSSSSSQESIYLKSVSKMVEKLFKGYNVTILAYGQTGSGKTYSMGTVCSDIYNNEAGVIPRSVKDIFSEIDERNEEDIFVKVSFIELYKERVYDLLNTRCREDNVVDIREDPKGGIKMVGLTEIPVTTLEETMQCLQHGALNRATGATAMNLRSSRSHAIFSLHIEIGKKNERDNIITSKFHLVDLAGSERAKKTGATGERFKEGVNINKGLLALGNVISSLCGEGSKSHIPYRDSKLTRLLQDSLGGNSHTLMLACVSPADSNLEETLSTLRYADRARKIKNKPTINRDPQAAELAHLRQQVQQLQVQLLASQSVGGGGENVPVGTSTEIGALINQIHTLEDENEKLTKALQTALDENTNMAEKALMAEMGRDQMKTRLEELRAQTGNTVDVLNKTFDVTSNPQFTEQINLVKDLQRKIIDLQSEQSKREKAIVEHELSRHTISTNTEPVKFEDDDGETVSEDDDSSPMKGEFGATFTLRQAKLNEELTDLNKALAMKEQLMSKLTTNDTQYVMMKSSYEKNLKELEQQINSLIKEKEELNQKLRSASTQNASNKIAEQRRKRLMELENLISGLKKKIGEQNKLLRLKEQSEQKVVKLNSEIQNMKSVRVKLIRQMKEDSEKFRQWKAQKDREVAKLKEEDRKKQFQIVKMERLHSKQQNVLKRKMEEAVAINKRLKDAMALQKSCQEKRNNAKDIGNANSRLKYWLNGELEVVLAKSQAQKSLQTLIEDRKTISTRLNQAKRQLNKEELSETLEEQLRNRINVMEKDLQLRTAQISDLQSKIVEDDAEVTNKKRFDSIQTMVESKLAMQHLFQVASEKQVLAASHESDLQELNNHYEEVCQNLEEAEKAIKEMKLEHQKEMDQLSREHEDKILFLLRQLPQTKTESEGSTDNDENDELLQRLKFQEEELARMSHLHDLLVQKTQECEDLKRNLESERQKSVDVEKDHVMATPPAILVPRTPIMKKEGKKTSEKLVSIGAVEERREPDDFSTEESEEDDDDSEEEENSEAEGSDDEFEEDKQKDPDWRKTPLFKRIRQMTSRGRSLRVEPSSLENEDFSGGVKRTSEGKTRCKCSKSCSSKLCSCKKAGGACNVDCKCNALVCVNRVTPNNTLGSSMEGSKCDTLLNSTFDVCSSQSSEPLTESSYNKKAKLSNKELKKIDATTVDPLKIEELDFSMPPL